MGSDLLIQAFENFRQASTSLERVHQELSRKVLSLSEQLERKNDELTKNLAEKEELHAFLDSILAHLANGVLVTSRGGQVRVSNPVVWEFLGWHARPASQVEQPAPQLPAEVWNRLRNVVRQQQGPVEITRGDRVLLVSGKPFFAATRGEELFVFVFQDITGLRRLEEERNRQAKLSAMGEMAIQLAHEIRNPLGGIQLYLSLLKSSARSEDETGWFRSIEAGLATISYIVSNMLQFYRPLHLNPEFVLPWEVVEESAALLEPIARTREVALRRRNNYEGLVIYADREQLKQLIMNLLRNAFNAIPEKGEIGLELDGPLAGPSGGERPYCRLTVRDNGVGMDEETKQRLFEPFWSSNTSGHGIGLWVSRQIIEMHGGQIQVESRKGKGTCLTVYLPVYQSGDEHEQTDLAGG